MHLLSRIVSAFDKPLMNEMPVHGLIENPAVMHAPLRG
jgi:hypothetical protein